MNGLHPYIEFDGVCRDAMTSYQEWFGGELSLIPVEESPARDQQPRTGDTIYHSELRGLAFTLMGSDKSGSASRSAIVVDCEDEEIGRVFGLASEGGTVMCGLGPAPWGGSYAHLTDRFGTTWHLMCSTGRA